MTINDVPEQEDYLLKEIPQNQDSKSASSISSPVKIHKLILKNFLSFVYDEVEFDHEFSICTGPNGAGKSSIYQAIKFVLGSNHYDGRYSKWADFIHFEADNAIVEIQLLVKERLYKIQRRVEREKTPKFWMQNPEDSKLHPANVKTVDNFIQSIGIDPNNVFAFMSQGNIDSIKDFREEVLCTFVESGIGLQPLKTKILEQKEKVRLLNQNYETLIIQKKNYEHQLSGLEPKLRRLQKKQELLSKYHNLEEELLIAQYQKINLEITEKQNQIQVIQDEIHVLLTDNSQIFTFIHRLEQELIDLQTEFEAKTQEILQKTTRQELVISEINRKTAEKDTLAEKIRTRTGELAEINQQIEKQRYNVNKILNDFQELQKFILDTKEELAAIETERDEIFEEFEENKELLQSYEKKSLELEKLDDRMQSFGEKIKNHSQEIREKEKSINEFNQDLSRANWFTDNPTLSLKSDLSKRKQRLTTSIQNLSSENESLIKENRDLNYEYKKITQNFIEKDRFPPEIEKMLQQIREQHIECEGPLFNLLYFESKYNFAVQSMMGKRVLNSFFAKNERDFRRLVELAKKSGVMGNIYFNKKETLQSHSRPISPTPGIYGYLSDLIEITSNSSLIQKVVDSIAANVIVVEDHDTGMDFINRYKSQNWMVTLDGEQIRPKTGFLEARPFITPNNLKFADPTKIQAHIDSLQNKITQNDLRITENSQELQLLNSEYKELEEKLQQFEILFSKYKQHSISSRFLEKYQRELRETKENLTNTMAEMDQVSEEIDALKPLLPEDSLEKKERIEEIKLLITSLKNKLADFEQTQQTLQQQQNDTTILLKNLEFQQTTKQVELDELNSLLKTQDVEFFNYMEENITLTREITNLKTQKNAVGSVISEKQELLSQKKGETENIELEKLKKEQQIANLQDQIAILQTKKKSAEQLLGNLDQRHTSREIAIIETDIHVITKLLQSYVDVDESLLYEKENCENQIEEIKKQQISLDSDIHAAQTTEKELEEIYRQKFQASINTLEYAVNNKFQLAKLSFSVALKLEGEIESLKLIVDTQTQYQEGELKRIPLSALSGGQRSMVGICLMLSLNELNPSPFNIYDEVEMFLDPQNAQVVARLIHQIAQSGIQFIILMPDKSKTLLQLANRVIGVSRNGKYGPSTVHYSKYQSNEAGG